MTKDKKTTKKSSKKSFLRKATLGATAAALVAGAGGQAQAWGIKDGLSDLTSGAGKVVKGVASVGLGAAALPFQVTMDLGKWAVKNPGKAAAITIGTIGAAWLGLTYKNELVGAVSAAAKTVSDKYGEVSRTILEPAGKSIASFFGTAKATIDQYADAASTQAKNAWSQVPSLDDLATKVQGLNKAGQEFATSKASDFSTWWNTPGYMAAFATKAQENWTNFADFASKNATKAFTAGKEAASHIASAATNTPVGAVVTAEVVKQGVIASANKLRGK